GSPHADPDETKPLSWQEPEEQVSWFTHSEPASPHELPSAAWLDAQAPEPSQLSGSSHSVSEESPHETPEATGFGEQPPTPLQLSAPSHSVTDGSPHAVPADTKPLSEQPPEPSQVSWFTQASPASPQADPFAAWLTWQAPVPSQVSGSSHSVSDP